MLATTTISLKCLATSLQEIASHKDTYTTDLSETRIVSRILRILRG